MQDYTKDAVQAYILYELEKIVVGKATVQYFTDGCNNQDRKEITEGLNALVEGGQITREGNFFRFKTKENNEKS